MTDVEKELRRLCCKHGYIIVEAVEPRDRLSRTNIVVNLILAAIFVLVVIFVFFL